MIYILLITVQITLSVICDLHCYKVKNVITFTFALLGIVYNIYIGDMQIFYSAILGLMLPFILLLPLYILKMLGAGDIKLFCSIGALVGGKAIFIIIVYSFLTGGIVALMIMLVQKNTMLRIRYLLTYIKCSILTMSIQPYDDLRIINNSKMHFTIGIALGTALFYLQQQ